jgi:low affinity Fe/Cu permease
MSNTNADAINIHAVSAPLIAASATWGVVSSTGISAITAITDKRIKGVRYLLFEFFSFIL